MDFSYVLYVSQGGITLKQLLIMHPFLFAIFPILFLFAYNIDEVPASDLWLPMSVALIGTLILFFSLRLITKNYNKIGIITTFFLVLFFSYGHIRDLVISYTGLEKGRISVNLLLASLWVLLFITVAFLITKSHRNFSTSTKFLNIVAIALVAISLINIGIYEIRTINRIPETANKSPTGLSVNNAENLPDIYYIILDEYARQDTLKEFWDYDNSEFIDYLTSKGFYVASKSRSNYGSTSLSLPSSLNMEYLDNLGGTVTMQDGRMVGGEVLANMISNSKASRFLKSKGYRYIHVNSRYYWKEDISKYAEVLARKGAFGIMISNFTHGLLRTTALAPFDAYFSGYGRAGVLYAFDALADIPDIKEPTFVFAYLNSPHPPFLFDRDGNPVRSPLFQEPDPAEQLRRRHQAYLEQLIFITKKVEILVGEILSKSDVPPIIILQADTGPGSYIRQPGWELIEDPFMQERWKIFNVYFLPNNGKKHLYETITPVNSFRLVFNLYFDANYDLLEDKSYAGGPGNFTLIPPEVEEGTE